MAQDIKIDFKRPINRNVNELGTAYNTRCFNGYFDEEMNFNKRPGQKLLIDFSTNDKINGIFYWPSLDITIAVVGTKIKKIERVVDETFDVTDITGAALEHDARCTFAIVQKSGVEYLFIANGGKIVYTNGTAVTAFLTGANIPTTVSHVAFKDQYLLCNQVGTRYFYHSDVSDPFTFSVGAFEATTLNDQIMALTEGFDDIMLWGKRQIEVWYNDGSSPFSRREGATVDRGVSAAYSVVKANFTYYFLDNQKQFCVMDGRAPKVISGPIQSIIQNLGTVSDCHGELVQINGQNLIVWVFPTEGKTFVYDYDENIWNDEWTWYDTVSGTDKLFKCNYYNYVYGWDIRMMGDHNDGKIFKFTSDALDDNGTLINWGLDTQHVTHGTSNRKISKIFRIFLHRGHGPSADAVDPQIMVSFQDNNGLWSNEIFASLGKIGDGYPRISFFRMGTYISRRWRFRCTDSVPLCLIDMQESVEVTTR